ncbi:hypothetical protein [Serratia quinivorans]|uniref:hypothetical protein n=1 Tax=Serratia quinivorans TaxID=137545 RepID=UPI002177F556|nr:hypothetical protein [Serratia quinivorans]CAI1597277.1 Uncharacterised protein [Serratia quinivorans]CAI1676746.1 Uncharacterised protein [Serratia quinivorans]
MKQSLFFSAVVLLSGTLQLSHPAGNLLIEHGSIPLGAEPAVIYQPRIAEPETPPQELSFSATDLEVTLTYWDLFSDNAPLF